MRTLLLLSLLIVATSCDNKTAEVDTDEIKEDIIAIENAFANAAADQGVKEAFLAYAADEAVLVR